jgi:hypothetical protein
VVVTKQQLDAELPAWGTAIGDAAGGRRNLVRQPANRLSWEYDVRGQDRSVLAVGCGEGFCDSVTAECSADCICWGSCNLEA